MTCNTQPKAVGSTGKPDHGTTRRTAEQERIVTATEKITGVIEEFLPIALTMRQTTFTGGLWERKSEIMTEKSAFRSSKRKNTRQAALGRTFIRGCVKCAYCRPNSETHIFQYLIMKAFMWFTGELSPIVTVMKTLSQHMRIILLQK